MLTRLRLRADIREADISETLDIAVSRRSAGAGKCVMTNQGCPHERSVLDLEIPAESGLT